MSVAQIINELQRLTDAEREAVLEKLLELGGRLREPGVHYRAVDLQQRGITEPQAADLRARLKAFAEDWDRPEAAIYDEDPPRWGHPRPVSQL